MNSAQLDILINDFYNECDSLSSQSWLDKDQARNLWQQVKEINTAFKDIRYATRDDREYAWQRFQEAIGHLKRSQEESRANTQKFAKESEEHRNEILRLLEKANPNLIDSLVSVFTGLIFAAGDIGASVFLPSLDPQIEELKRNKEELRRYSEYLQEARTLFRRYKDAMTGSHKKEVFETIKAVSERLNRAWEESKKAWDTIHNARREARQIREQQFIERQNKTKQFIEKQEDFLKKLYSNLSRREDHLRELHYKLDTAHLDDFKNRVYEWIREEEKRIDDIKSKVREVEAKVDDARRRLK